MPVNDESRDHDALLRSTEDAHRGTRLSREFILDAAIALIDRSGLPQLSMRRLGAAGGVEAMALYRYVRSRGDLLTGVDAHRHRNTAIHSDRRSRQRVLGGGR